MAPKQFLVRLQHGIIGGFAPPTPDAVYNLSRDSEACPLTVTAAVRPDGTPSLGDNTVTSLSVNDETAALVDELQEILKSIPTEEPLGSEDIYGLNTGIMWASDDLVWANGGPEGCVGGESMVQATQEQKVKFKRAVEIVKELVKRSA